MALVAYIALRVLFYAMLLRLILDLVRGVNPSWRPRGIILGLAEIVMTVTDPFIEAMRKIIPPIRIGSIAFDLGWTILMIAIGFLSGVVQQL